ncbi:MAG: TrmH family RNA methyltransferase [Bacilli bacterium]|jgi:TrmH family RNA methyltransferase|nr:TrmH family RNA methyltransferase [Bacilli bacterium]MCH4210346.1 TrmH family RNA methyltransferase [Bacilli bacterium]MCH4228884.1 TrmH family RNA methyltransferase [Bacilli bacterium]MCH4277972.1 TrmH family RNA methyltransferase [Bacilli bacterium]MCI2054764.1 TrmH family RNA methyltransferase [Bacilli bacterium]
MEKYDKKNPTSYAIGTTLAIEALLRKGEYVKKLYVSVKQNRDETYQKLMSLAKLNNVSVIENNQKIFSSLSGKDNVMFIAEFTKFSSSIDIKGNHVVLVNPSNMGNLGTIMRSSAAFGISFLAIISPGADAFDPKVIRSSMGAIFSLPFAYFPSFEEYAKQAGERHYYPFMLQSSTDLRSIKKEKPYSLVFGNEATGLDDSYLKIGTPVKIPQSSMVDSLNLDNAVSIGIYSFLD